MGAAPIVAVAYSGGRDSSALLHATLATAREVGVRVLALHVHHGLSPHADGWLEHCRRTCARWRRAGQPVDFRCARLEDRPPPGGSIEAWARDRRYAALASMAKEGGATIVLLAHHRRDQAETFLLQALRGAGAIGLAAMPPWQERDGLVWARPWLETDPAAIEAYATRHRLAWVDDESNRDPRYGRSRLRTDVWEAFERAFPQAEASLARSARWMRDAAAGLDDLARIDLAAATVDGGALRVEPLRSLAPHRRVNALRVWLREALGGSVPASLLTRLDEELWHGGPASWPCAGGCLRLWRGRLRVEAAGPPASPARATVAVTGPGRYTLAGWPGTLVARRVREGGIAVERLRHADARPRQGGEQFQAGPGRPARSLKKQFQAAGVDRWRRDGPRVWHGRTLLFVPGLGIDARAVAAPGDPQLGLEWLPAPPPS